MRTITWNYDTNTVTEWCRLGGCNHCGECCRVVINLDSANSDEPRLGSEYTTELDVWYQSGDLLWGNIRITEESIAWDCYEGVADDDTFIDEQGEWCQGFSIDDDQRGRCNHESKRKKGLCTAWPLHPDHVNEFDNCSYRFVKLNEWEIEAYDSV